MMVFSISAVIISLPGAILNILLLIVFIKDPLKCFRNSATYLVANLTTSDCATCSFFLLLPLILRLFGQNPIFNFFVYWLTTTSCISIASISIDRFLMVAYPIKHRILIQGRFIILWIAAIWIVSCLPSVVIHYGDDDKIYVNALYTFNVVIVIVSAGMYSLTYYQLKKQSRNIYLKKLKWMSCTRNKNKERKEIFEDDHHHCMCCILRSRPYYGILYLFPGLLSITRNGIWSIHDSSLVFLRKLCHKSIDLHCTLTELSEIIFFTLLQKSILIWSVKYLPFNCLLHGWAFFIEKTVLSLCVRHTSQPLLQK